MKKMLSLVLALMLVLCAASALAEGDTTIIVMGAAEVSAAPDMATLSANAAVSANSVSEAQTQLNAIIDRVTGSLKALGIDDADIVTQNYSYYPLYNYDTATPTIIGYQANHTLSVICRDVALVDRVLTTLVDGGMTDVYNVQFGMNNQADLYQQALVKAVAHARIKVEAMAQAQGLTLGHLEKITENTAYYDAAQLGIMRDMAASEKKAGLRSGNVTVTASVTVEFETK